MRLTRCFVETSLAPGTEFALPDNAAQHVARVLRARVGDGLTLFNGQGGEFEADILAITRDAVRVRVGTQHVIERESPAAITLLQGLARGDRMDFIVQKATELGVAAIIPVSGERSVVKLDGKNAERKREHWRQVAISACEQCGRNRVPQIGELTSILRACADVDANSRRLMLQPGAARSLAEGIAGANALTLLIGPEGGLSPQEIEAAQHVGFIGCRLGPRILRTETAPLAALAAIQALGGDF